MDCLPRRLSLCLLLYIHAVVLSWRGSSAVTFGNGMDGLALLAFKSKITQDSLRVMSSWNDSIHFCEWIGVTCSMSNRRVVILSLEGQELVGSISPSVGNLSFLTGINLRNNNFNGKIPEELGRLSRLQYLNLTYNSLEGEIPLNLTRCLDLRGLEVSNNKLKGNIPYELSNFKKLRVLGLGGNNLTGIVPPWIGNYSSLFAISLARNSFHGSIPNDFGRLSQLGFFQVYDNMLSGTIPPSLFNISSIYFFSVAKNQLHGSLPPNVGLTLPNLQVFAGGVNNFQGPIPGSLSNASGLQVLDFAENGFTGSVPIKFGSLLALSRLNFGSNLLGSGKRDDLSIITALVNCTGLEVLGLEYNRLRGELPESIGNLSGRLRILTVGGNLISGSLPTVIENLVNLTVLGLEGNLFSGSIPFSIGKLQKLQRLHFNVNRLSGMIPSSLGNLTLLNYLFMEENRLEGSIPPSLGNCQKLLVLNISRNNLTGAIPKQVLTLSSLSISLALAHNSLSGSLPSEVGKLVNLEELEISENKLSGEMPVSLSNCLSLERLKMGGNLFHGVIPQSLKDLKGIQVIDFSRNNLSGRIPEFLMNASSLEYLDLSFNDLEGTVPKEGIFMNASETVVRGNKKLCGGIKELRLPACTEQARPTSRKSLSVTIIVSMAIAVVVLVLLSCFGALCCLRKLRKRKDATDTTGTSYSENGELAASYLDIFNSTDGFSSECLIGEGSFGSVYRGVVSDERRVVAIKVLKLEQQGALKSFIAECDALKNIRHRNLIKVITACSSCDFKGNDFKALVLEYMSNGSLEQWLHPNTDGQQPVRNFSLVQRLNIGIDVAFALEYLHHCYEETIVHCDLKPSNILLDADMTAHVGDFGLARFLFNQTDNLPKQQAISLGLKGSIGYIPPEYGMGGQVSTQGDMYSYGILLLEMFTGRRPTDERFKDGLSLYSFVATALPDRVVDVVDPILLSKPQQEDQDIGMENNAKENREETTVLKRASESLRRNVGDITEEVIVLVMRIGLACCAPSPKDRMVVRDVLSKLIPIRDSFVGSPEQSKRVA